MIPCKIYNDLILLYVSEECTEYTKQLVEEHLKVCPDCQKHYQDLLEPIAQTEFDPELLEEKVKDFEVKKSFFKIRERWFISFVSMILIMGLMIGISYLTYNQVRGEGVCFTNQDEIIMTKSFFNAVKSGNYEKAFSMLDIDKMYKYITLDQVENLVNFKGNLYSVDPIYALSTDEREALISKATECAEYYRKMGFEYYKEKQWNEFLRRMEDLKSQGVTIKNYSIDAIDYMKNEDNDSGCWDIDYKVKYNNQNTGWITLRSLNGSIQVIGDKWGTNKIQSNFHLPEDVDNCYTYTYTGENERWNAELMIIGSFNFTKTDSGMDVETEDRKVLEITYKGEISDLSDVNQLEIYYACNNEYHKSVLDIGDRNTSKSFTIDSVTGNGSLYDGDEIITVMITEKGEIKETLVTTEIDGIKQNHVTGELSGLIQNIELKGN